MLSREGWVLTSDEEFKSIRFPEQWQMLVSSDSIVPSLASNTVDEDEDEKKVTYQPQLLFYPDGSSSGAKLEVYSDGIGDSDEAIGLNILFNGRVNFINEKEDVDEI